MISAPTATARRTPSLDLATEIRDTLRILQRGEPGVVEVRIFCSDGKTLVGYFDDAARLATAVTPHNGVVSIFVTLNRLPPSALARAANRLAKAIKSPAGVSGTSDLNITRRRWVFIDIDALGTGDDDPRVSGVSATDAEKAAALARRADLVDWLRGRGWPEPVLADSGNGGHALYAVDLPNTAAIADLIKALLHALAARFNAPGATLDESVYNAARITKLYGTVAVKGDAIPGRPRRRCFIDVVPDVIDVVTEDQLRDVAALAPSPSSTARDGAQRPVLDFVAVLRERGLYKRPLSGDKHAITCPWETPGESHASSDSSTVLFEPREPGASWGFKCMFGACADRSIRDVLAFLGLGRSANGTPGEARESSSAVWSLAKSAEELIAAGGVTLEAVDFPLAARGSITEINAPRGTGKNAVVLARMVAQARRGLRVLFLDRDNSPATLRKRLVGLGAGAVPSLKVLTRDVAPSFADGVAWGAFPLEHFDVVVIDSWDTFAEGAGEQDSRRSTLALASLLDMVRRERAPAVILLCNVTKDGAAGRGSGTVEDRADNVFEVRDATGFAPTGKRPWWEELPPAARSEWAARATRRTGHDRPERIRLAFIATKFRDDDEPAPFVLELDFTAEPWALRDVTNELVAAGDASRAAVLANAMQAQENAARALVAELARRAADSGAKPLLVEPATALLIAHDLKRRAARELLKSGGDGRWRLEPLDRKSVGVILADPVSFPGRAAQSKTVGICTVERSATLSKCADRMDIERRDSHCADPAKHAGGAMSTDCAVENGYTREPDAEGEV